MYKWQIIKRYGHEQGLSTTFRQFRAPETHCSFLHGYPLAFEVCFEGNSLDDRNWLISFGDLKPFKQWLTDTFDHKTLVSVNDPKLPIYLLMEQEGLAQLTFVPEVGCELVAKLAYDWLLKHLDSLTPRQNSSRVRVKYVMVSEHGGNSARYEPSDNDLFWDEPSEVLYPDDPNEEQPISDAGHVKADARCVDVKDFYFDFDPFTNNKLALGGSAY